MAGIHSWFEPFGTVTVLFQTMSFPLRLPWNFLFGKDKGSAHPRQSYAMLRLAEACRKIVEAVSTPVPEGEKGISVLQAAGHIRTLP